MQVKLLRGLNVNIRLLNSTFGDVSGYGNYELLNSTKRGELRDDNWERRITVD